MPAISPVLDRDVSEPEGEVLPLQITRQRRRTARAMWAERAQTFLWRGVFPLLYGLRRSWLYRQTLTGPLPAGFLFHPSDPRARRLDEADAIMRGRFRLAGQTLEITQGSIFDAPGKSVEFQAALHGFEWLRHLEAAGGGVSRDIALVLAKNWLRRYSHFTLPAWRPHVMAMRLFNFFAHGRFFLTNSDLVWRSKLFVSLREQTIALSRSLGECEEGLPRFVAAAGLAVAGLCLGKPRCARRGLMRLVRETKLQIAPDGSHVSRSPEALLETFRWLNAVNEGLAAANMEMDGTLKTALERIAAMVRYLCMGDGTLACFHGGNQGEKPVVAALLKRVGRERSQTPADAPHSGFHRLSAGETVILIDTGTLPPVRFSGSAHAGCLAFEASTGEERMIVNCGAGSPAHPEWRAALRTTASHSTLTLDDTSQALQLKDTGLGPRMTGGPSLVETRRAQSAAGISLESTQNAYVSRFGLLHQRRLTLDAKGERIIGLDRLIAAGAHGRAKTVLAHARRTGLPFAVRFHVHPDVRLSLAKAGGSVILKLPSGKGWRFRCGGGALSIEESIYWGEGFPRRAEQLVVNGVFQEKQAEIAWSFEKLG